MSSSESGGYWIFAGVFLSWIFTCTSTLSSSFGMICSPRDLDVDHSSVCDPHLMIPYASYSKVKAGKKRAICSLNLLISYMVPCYLSILSLFHVPWLLLLVGIQLIVMEGIMVVRAWAIVGRQPRVLWIFLGLLTLSTIASLVLYVLRIEHADSTYSFYLWVTYGLYGTCILKLHV